jgi:hypothetical protein
MVLTRDGTHHDHVVGERWYLREMVHTMIMWAGERELKLGQGVQLAVHIRLLENTESLDA